jgi:hypothetical protein
MAAVANNPQFARRAGVPQSVGREYMKADEGRSFNEGGDLVSNCGTKRKGYKKGGYHRMPDGTMMKDSEHRGMKEGGRASMDTGSRNMTMRKVDTENGIPVLVPPRMNYGGKVKGMKEGGMCRGYGRARGNKPVRYS